MKTSVLDLWLREHGIAVNVKKEDIVYTNQATGRSTVVPRRPLITDGFARDICDQLEVPVPVSIRSQR